MDVAGLLDAMPFKMGELPEHLRSVGFETVSYKGVLRWRRDNSLPSDRLAAILRICAMSGQPIDVNEYVVVEPVKEATNAA